MGGIGPRMLRTRSPKWALEVQAQPATSPQSAVSRFETLPCPRTIKTGLDRTTTRP